MFGKNKEEKQIKIAKRAKRDLRTLRKLSVANVRMAEFMAIPVAKLKAIIKSGDLTPIAEDLGLLVEHFEDLAETEDPPTPKKNKKPTNVFERMKLWQQGYFWNKSSHKYIGGQ